MIKWMRQSGSEIETNETKASIEYAELNKWERVVEVEKEVVKPVSSKAKGVKKIDNGNKNS